MVKVCLVEDVAELVVTELVEDVAELKDIEELVEVRNVEGVEDDKKDCYEKVEEP